MSIVIVYGPKASGKTSNAEFLRKKFGCKRIVDDWDTAAVPVFADDETRDRRRR